MSEYFIRNFLSFEAIASMGFMIVAAVLFWAAAKYTPGNRNGG